MHWHCLHDNYCNLNGIRNLFVVSNYFMDSIRKLYSLCIKFGVVVENKNKNHGFKRRRRNKKGTTFTETGEIQMKILRIVFCLMKCHFCLLLVEM